MGIVGECKNDTRVVPDLLHHPSNTIHSGTGMSSTDPTFLGALTFIPVFIDCMQRIYFR